MYQIIISLCDCLMQFQSKAHISPLLTRVSSSIAARMSGEIGEGCAGANTIWNLFFSCKISVDALFDILLQFQKISMLLPWKGLKFPGIGGQRGRGLGL